MERSVVGRPASEGLGFGVSPVETVIEDRRDRDVGGRADVVAASARRFDTREARVMRHSKDRRPMAKAS
jgi:hypothetical protein